MLARPQQGSKRQRRHMPAARLHATPVAIEKPRGDPLANIQRCTRLTILLDITNNVGSKHAYTPSYETVLVYLYI
jgi:hypothetical protein